MKIFKTVSASVTSGSPLVTVSLPAHGLNTGDFVTVHTAATLGGITGFQLSASACPVTVLSSGSFRYAASGSASSTASGLLANLSGSPAALYQTVASQLDIPSYIDYMATISFVGTGDHATKQFRAWRHPDPADRRWRLIAWDGDANAFKDGNLGPFSGDSYFLTSGDKLHPQDPNNAVPFDLIPHESLKFHPLYRAAWDTRLRYLITSSSANPGPNIALSQANVMSRFDAVGGDFRRTLECEAMRWDGTYAQGRMKGWRSRIKFFRDGNGGAEGPPGPAPYDNGYVRQSRTQLKTLARDSRLLNDIQPPVITVSGNTATISRISGTGRIYFRVGSAIEGPAISESNPTYSASARATMCPGANDESESGTTKVSPTCQTCFFRPITVCAQNRLTFKRWHRWGGSERRDGIAG